MSKQTKIIILIIILFILVTCGVTALTIYYKTHPVQNDKIITQSFLEDISNRYDNNEEISAKEFKDFTVLSEEVKDGFKYTNYQYNELYDVNTITIKDTIYAIYLVNRVTNTSCDILHEDMHRYFRGE